MKESKYYPVVDCDSDGKQKVALFPTYNRDTVSRNHSLWLEEMIPHHFRLCSNNGAEPRIKGSFIIHCPVCNKPLKLIGSATDNTRRGLYECSSCNKD